MYFDHDSILGCPDILRKLEGLFDEYWFQHLLQHIERSSASFDHFLLLVVYMAAPTRIDRFQYGEVRL